MSVVCSGIQGASLSFQRVTVDDDDAQIRARA